MKKKTWYPLDNAAKIYPPNTGFSRPNNFSFSFVLTEEVVPEQLSVAVEMALSRIPIFKTKLKKGIFWYYLEENHKPFKIAPDEGDYLRYIEQKSNSDYLFKIYYSEHKITIVVFHALCDGYAGLKMLKTILYEYLKLRGYDIKTEGLIKPSEEPESFLESQDSFSANYEKPKHKVPGEKRAFRITGTPFDYDGYGIITGKLSVAQVKALAAKYNTTITGFLSGVYLYHLYCAFVKNANTSNKITRILIPLDMRKLHSSETMRNFSLFVRLCHDFKTPLSLDECISLASAQLKSARDNDKLDDLMRNNVKYEKSALLKLTPLFLKNIVLRLSYSFMGENLQTGNISNVGALELPESIKPFVKSAIFAIAPTFSCRQQTGIISVGDDMYITTTREFKETVFERGFYRTLASFGLDVTVFSNNWEARL